MLACQAVALASACSSGSGDGDDTTTNGNNPAASGGSTGNTGGSTTTTTAGTSTGDTTGGTDTTGAGGSTGGDDPTPRCTATLTPSEGTCNIIDDFEDGSGEVGGRPAPPGDGRGPGGSWDVVRPIDLTSTYEFTAVTDGAPGSTQGIHWAATGVDANQGASIGLSFGPCYQATPTYTGFTFWARAEADVDLIAGVNDALSHGEVDCHGADSVAEPGSDACYGSFRKTVSVTSTWQQFTVNWGELVQASWGTPQHPLEPGKLVSLVFIVLEDFDLTIDDIEFIGGDATTCGMVTSTE